MATYSIHIVNQFCGFGSGLDPYSKNPDLKEFAKKMKKSVNFL
jgi:hypothetical protein